MCIMALDCASSVSGRISHAHTTLALTSSQKGSDMVIGADRCLDWICLVVRFVVVSISPLVAPCNLAVPTRELPRMLFCPRRQDQQHEKYLGIGKDPQSSHTRRARQAHCYHRRSQDCIRTQRSKRLLALAKLSSHKEGYVCRIFRSE